MNKKIINVKQEAKFKMNNRTINKLCFAKHCGDGAILLADNEDELQRLLHKFSRQYYRKEI